MKKKKYRYNPPRFEYLGAFKLGQCLGKVAPACAEKITSWDWERDIPVFFIFYDYAEKEYVLYTYHFKDLSEPVIDDHKLINYTVKFAFNEHSIDPGELFKDPIVNKAIKFRPVFGTSSQKMDLWLAQYIIARHADLNVTITSQDFDFEPKKSGHAYADHEITQRLNATVEGYIKDYAEPFFDFDFESS